MSQIHTIILQVNCVFFAFYSFSIFQDVFCLNYTIFNALCSYTYTTFVIWITVYKFTVITKDVSNFIEHLDD